MEHPPSLTHTKLGKDGKEIRWEARAGRYTEQGQEVWVLVPTLHDPFAEWPWAIPLVLGPKIPLSVKRGSEHVKNMANAWHDLDLTKQSYL